MLHQSQLVLVDFFQDLFRVNVRTPIPGYIKSVIAKYIHSSSRILANFVFQVRNIDFVLIFCQLSVWEDRLQSCGCGVPLSRI